MTHTPWKNDHGLVTRVNKDGFRSFDIFDVREWQGEHEEGLEIAETIVTAVNSHDGLLEALEKLEPLIGWRGTGEKSTEGYYCEFCKAYHEDDDLLPHAEGCLLLEVRAAIKAARGTDTGTPIPHHGSGP